MQSFLQLLQTNVFAAALVSFVPIALWIWFFQAQHREKKGAVALAFAAGMISVVPIKIYEKYWSTAIWHLEHVNIFQHIAELVNVPQMATFLAFLVASVVVALGIFLFIALAMGALEIISFDNSATVFLKKFKRLLDTPFLFVSAGVLVALVAFSSMITLHDKVWFFLMVGMLEEFTKHLCLRFADEEKINSVDDAISYAIIVALGFAFVENVMYVQNFISAVQPTGQQFTVFFLLRSSVSVIAHVCFSAIFGYFYGLAMFSHELYWCEVQQRRHVFLQWLHRVVHLKGEVVYREEKMMEGLLLAMVLHAIFNSLLEFNHQGKMIALIVCMFVVVLNLYHRIRLHRHRGNVVTID